MKVITIFFLFALLLIVGCSPASHTVKFFDNRNNNEYKINTVLYKDGIVVNINDIRTVVARFSPGQKDVSAIGTYKGHEVRLSGFYTSHNYSLFESYYWNVTIYIDNETAGDFELE